MDLSDEQWRRIRRLIPQPKSGSGRPGRPARPARDVLNGILWILRTGSPWRALPSCYPAFQTCHQRFQFWCSDGTLRRILTTLRHELGEEHEEGFIDGTYIGAKRGGDCVGRSRGGNTTKLMALADRDGLPLSVEIASGSRHDVVLVDQTLEAAFVRWLPERLIGDRAFDSGKLAASLSTQRHIELIAPKRGGKRPSRRQQDGRAMRRYKRRWLVERLFAWLKRFRRISTRWECKASNFLGFVHLGCIMILLRHT